MEKTRVRTLMATALLAVLAGAVRSDVWAQGDEGRGDQHPITIAKQGSFMVGGTVITSPTTGQTLHGDHAYVQFQIPLDVRDLPLVMWHGGGQSAKTWESTPDGREGYQTIFLRRGFAVYLLDQPRRGRAGRTGAPSPPLVPKPDEQDAFELFRLGIWPNFFPCTQFPSNPDALEQFFRQGTPDTGPTSGTTEFRNFIADQVAPLFDKIGPAVLITHSLSGVLGWLTAIKNPNVKASVTYEPSPKGFVFPEGGSIPPGFTGVSPAEFQKLTSIPIQIVYGDNISTNPSDVWRTSLTRAAVFVDEVNRRGGDASVLHLPDIGVYGNTHFAFSDLNNLQIADLLSVFLREKGLDARVASGRNAAAAAR